jgi:two-component system nitrogen regulation response regulator NtrX
VRERALSTILVVDDEQGIREVLQDVLSDEGHRVVAVQDGFQALEILQTESVDLVILDVWLPNMGGIDVLKRIREAWPDIEVVVISGHANINMAVQAVKIGAFDFLEKPLSLDKTITVVENALKLEELKRENRTLKQSIFFEDEMIGSGEGMRKVRELIEQSADSDARILILGENGTGKELVAREIHRRSRRSEAPFVEVNCASIPETLIESELFGHEKGAFTDAHARRKGKFELADGGTLFLDEIADMSLSTQAKVLRVLQEMKFERIGGEKSISVDVRVIAATNKNIQEEIRAGRFREDLYFRINVIPIFVPPLRERIEDLPELIDYFMHKLKRSPEGPPRQFSEDALHLLRTYSWPGNIRELKNFIERINIMSEEKVISADSVRRFLTSRVDREREEVLRGFESMKLNEAKDEFEREFLVKKLEENEQNITRTSRALGITPSHLHNKIKKHGIEIKK